MGVQKGRKEVSGKRVFYNTYKHKILKSTTNYVFFKDLSHFFKKTNSLLRLKQQLPYITKKLFLKNKK